jgi:hypothetical protein
MGTHLMRKFICILALLSAQTLSAETIDHTHQIEGDIDVTVRDSTVPPTDGFIETINSFGEAASRHDAVRAERERLRHEEAMMATQQAHERELANQEVEAERALIAELQAQRLSTERQLEQKSQPFISTEIALLLIAVVLACTGLILVALGRKSKK